jgi:VIT1/CCC1 family predicted Fe2+/Mn2+ transporter
MTGPEVRGGGAATRLGRVVAGGRGGTRRGGSGVDGGGTDGAEGQGRPSLRAVRRRHSHDAGKDVLRDVILGGQDGLVNILGIVLGVIAGGGDRTVLLSAGFAAAITESISMGAVGYTSTVADRDYYSAQRSIEEESLTDDPDLEREEVRELYKSKGFSGALLDQVVATITSNRDKWLGTIMEEERHLEPVATGDIVRSSVVITIATLLGHLIPLAPFLFLPRYSALILAIVLSALVLFGVGAYSAITRVGTWWKQGPRMILIGLGAAGLGFVIGTLFHAGTN